MIDLGEVQHLVARPTRLPAMRLTFLQGTPEGLRRLACAATGDGPLAVTSAAAAASADTTVNLGFTADGLRMLGITRRAHDALPAAFTAGMAAAADRLGDPLDGGTSWDPPLTGWTTAHAAILQLRCDPWDPTDLDDLRAVLPVGITALTPAWTGLRNADGTEPFGFRDDISGPELEGARPDTGGTTSPGNGVWDPDRGRWRPLRAGEAILGHVDESGTVAGHPDAAHLERNGSYLVIRRLEQDVRGFWAACEAWARTLGWTTDGGAADATRVAANLVGRHPDGTLLGREGAGATNDLLYRDPRFGPHQVPPSSHIRRTNPRDDLEFADQVVRRHLMLRRGYPYADTSSDGEQRQGLLFLACVADIGRQFEFVQRHWINDGDRFGLGAERDPIAGTRDGATGDATMASVDDDGHRHRCAFSTFVHHRGGGYVLLPSLATLGLLGSDQPLP